MSKSCDCKEDDVCPICLDSVLDEINKRNQIINVSGNVSEKELLKRQIEAEIEIKQALITMISSSEYIKKTKNEILSLKLLYDICNRTH